MTHLKIGDKAPAINSIDQNGDAITLEQLKLIAKMKLLNS
tara:strand:+ start:152 stop:271 length:120 start_codon:yes stop_codon:yes gene_type:complete